MEIYTPKVSSSFNASLSWLNHYNDGKNINPLCFQNMQHRFNKLKKSRKNDKDLCADLLLLFMELRFKCVRSFKLLKLTDEVEVYLRGRLGV